MAFVSRVTAQGRLAPAHTGSFATASFLSGSASDQGGQKRRGNANLKRSEKKRKSQQIL
jgi:hypothetical protein